MRVAVLLAALFLASAGVARSGNDVTMVVRDVSLHGSTRSLAVAAPRFNLVGVHWRGTGTPWYRTRSLSGRWSSWIAADDDWGRSGRWRESNGDWVGPSDGIEFRLSGRVTRLREYLLWSPPVRVPARRLSLAGSPEIIARSAWHADESIRRAPPVYAATLQFALVHHTVNSNAYSCAQSASLVRGIEIYHVKGNGWNDIGYNFLVDKCGQIFEGRYGGIDRNVVGAHSQGFNTGSVGVAVLGTYETTPISAAARASLVKLLAWRLDVAHVDPLSFVTYVSGGNSKYHAGIPVTLRAISGHRDTYFTECPGSALYAQLPAIAGAVAQTGLPKIFGPDVEGRLGGQIHFTARLSGAAPWTVTVADQSGAPVATGSGAGATVDWTWDSSSAPAGRYTWTIASGAARAATGPLGSKTAPPPPPFALQDVAISPQTISPNGDGENDSGTVSYTLTQPAQVTATLVDSTGATVSTLLTDNRPAGQQGFVFAADGVADGAYTIELTAVSASGATATAQLSVTVDRTLAALAVSPQVFSIAHPPLTVTFNLAYPEHATLKILDDAGHFVAQPFDGEVQAGPQTLTWDGTKRIGKLLDGSYQAVVVLQEATGPATYSVAFVADSHAPKLELVSVTRNVVRFRTSEDATVALTAGGHTYAKTVPAGLVSFWLKSVPAQFAATATDAAGNVSQPIGP